MLTKNKKKNIIPKIIHQIWVGPKTPPLEYLDLWRKYCEKHKWKYYLWTDLEVSKMKLKNQVCYDKATSYQQKSDILRYEILYKFGGVYIDADMICLGSNLEHYLPLNTSNFIGVEEPFACLNFSYLSSPFIANGFFASSKANRILRKCINEIPISIKLSNKAFIATGPGLLNRMIDIPITVIPTKWVFPENFRNYQNNVDVKKYKRKALVFTEAASNTLLKDFNFKKIPELVKTFINRLVYV